MIIGKTFEFSAAHHLPHVHELHKCRRVHGHNYKVEVVLDGPRNPDLGWVADYGDLKPFGDFIDSTLDHRDLNDVLDNPTAENLTVYLWHHAELRIDLPEGVILYEVTVRENDHSFATIGVRP